MLYMHCCHIIWCINRCSTCKLQLQLDQLRARRLCACCLAHTLLCSRHLQPTYTQAASGELLGQRQRVWPQPWQAARGGLKPTSEPRSMGRTTAAHIIPCMVSFACVLSGCWCADMQRSCCTRLTVSVLGVQAMAMLQLLLLVGAVASASAGADMFGQRFAGDVSGRGAMALQLTSSQNAQQPSCRGTVDGSAAGHVISSLIAAMLANPSHACSTSRHCSSSSRHCSTCSCVC